MAIGLPTPFFPLPNSFQPARSRVPAAETIHVSWVQTHCEAGLPGRPERTRRALPAPRPGSGRSTARPNCDHRVADRIRVRQQLGGNACGHG